jgi:hypothetical protein
VMVGFNISVLARVGDDRPKRCQKMKRSQRTRLGSMHRKEA